MIKTFHCGFHRGRIINGADFRVKNRKSEKESVYLVQSPCLKVNLSSWWRLSVEVVERSICRFLSRQKVIILLKYHPPPILVVVHNSCDIKVSSLAFMSWFINLYVPVVNVDLTKPLAKYAGEHCPVLLRGVAEFSYSRILWLSWPCNLFDLKTICPFHSCFE